jgi:hypothetical protein
MITKMEVYTDSPSAPELPLGGFMPGNDPIQVRDIRGLEPVKAEIATTPFATGRGELYQGSSSGKRNIVITLGLNPNWVDQTMSTLRQMLYAYFLPEAWVRLRFFSDYMATVDIEGYVESFEPNIFSQDPEIQISVICPKPDFIDVDATILTGTVDDGSTELEFDYVGTVNTGFELRIDRSVLNPAYTGPVTITVLSPTDPQIFVVDPVTIDVSDYFKLSTIAQAKHVQAIDLVDASAVNLLAAVADDAVWPIFKPGENVISVAADENDQAWTLAYFTRYGGL